MMVLREAQELAENMHDLVLTQNLKSNSGSMDTNGSSSSNQDCMLSGHLRNRNSNPLHLRGTNRYAEELRYNDPDYSPESYEFSNFRSTDETQARKPTTQSNPVDNLSENFIPIAEGQWIDIPAHLNCKEYTL